VIEGNIDVGEHTDLTAMAIVTIFHEILKIGPLPVVNIEKFWMLKRHSLT
jgi:hypothetical protein